MDPSAKRQKLVVGLFVVLMVVCAVTATVALAVYDMHKVPASPTALAALTLALPQSEMSLPTKAQPTETITPSPTVAPTFVDPVWTRIEQTGKIVVGMTADYPPFSYIDENFAIQGYDLALITEVGRRLGYPLEVKNISFEGLFSALQLNEIDVAVAAISLNQAREAYVNFSIVYYVGEDAVLAREDSTIEIGAIEDLAGYRVGVQRGSVYETWMLDMFIDPGMMRRQNLVLFDTPIEAAEALVQDPPGVDLVLVDALPAEIAERALEVKIVAREINPQLYALAIPNGAIILQAKLNEAMLQMQRDGTLSALAKRYLNVENPLPLPSQAPTLSATQDACFNSLALVADLNYPDYNMTLPPQFAPGFTFQKGWRILNSGTCTWNSDYVLTYMGSNPPNAPVGGNPVSIQGNVPPGQTYDIYVTITTPYIANIYQSFWTLRNSNGDVFAERIGAGFEVVIGTTLQPTQTTPQIYSFVVSPSLISLGECVNVSWLFGGIIRSSRLLRDGNVILYDLPANGSYSDCPGYIGKIEYRLLIDSTSAGSVTGTRYVDVLSVSQPTNSQPTKTSLPTTIPTSTSKPNPIYTPTHTSRPAPTNTPTSRPTEQPPVIESFTSSAQSIQLGKCVNLSWVFYGSGPLHARLFRGQTLLADHLHSPGSYQDCPTMVGNVEYRLVVDSIFGGSAERSLSIFVYIFSLTPISNSGTGIQSQVAP